MTGILVAMEQELACLENAGILNGADCVCALSGIGKVNAAASAVEMILRHRPDCIISTGVAGGLLPEMKPMDIVVGENVAYHDVWCGEGNAIGQVQGQPLYYPAGETLLKRARAVTEGDGKVRFGLIASGDQFFISQDEDRRILGLFPEALACDMESAAIAQVCRRYSVPFISIRFISDVHTTDEMQRSGYETFLDEYGRRSFGYIKKFIEYEKDSKF